MLNLKLLKLKNEPYYLPTQITGRTLAPTASTKQMRNCWVEGDKTFKKLVLAKTTDDQNLLVVGNVLEKLPDVTIFSHEFNNKLERQTNPQVVANKDVDSAVSLKKSRQIPKEGDMVLVKWIDASHNTSPATKKILKGWEGVIEVTQVGFFIHKNKKRIYMGGSYSKDHDTYKYLSAMPTMNIVSMVKLVEKTAQT